MKESNLKYDTPQIVKVKFDKTPNFNSSEDIVELKNDYSISVQRLNDESAVVILSLKVYGEADSIVPFTLEIANAARFYWSGYPSEVVEKMLDVNAPALLLGYLRPMVAAITNSSGLPPYNLPLINFNE